MNNHSDHSRFSTQLWSALLVLFLTTSLLSACVPLAGKTPRFTNGQYMRDTYCARIFDYQMATVGQLTIVIAEDPSAAEGVKAIAGRIIDLQDELSERSPIPLTQPVTVYVLPNPDMGECYSREDRVFADPNQFESREFIEEMLGAAIGIHEYWVLSGLTSIYLGEQPDTEALKSWYETTDDLDMAGLFIARFNEDWASEEEIRIARLSAASLLQYAMGVEKIPPEDIVEAMNNEVRTRWLASLGVNREVEYPYDGRFAPFTFSSSSECSLIVQADTMRFCLNRLPEDEYFDEIPEAEFLIDHAYYGRLAMEEYLLVEAPSVSDLLDKQEMITIEVRDLQNRLGYTEENTININRSAVYYAPLHEIEHTFNWSSILWHRYSWIDEGFAEYLGKLLPVYPQTQKRCIFEEINGQVRDVNLGYPPGISACYCLDPEQLDAAKAWYLAQGGQVESDDSIDPIIYTNAVAFATMYRDASFNGLPLGEIYETLNINRNLAGRDGLELSYAQAASFVAWLCDTYTIDRVLDVYVNLAEGGLLDGKSYSELKSAWQADLLARGQGIAIPGQP